MSRYEGSGVLWPLRLSNGVALPSPPNMVSEARALPSRESIPKADTCHQNCSPNVKSKTIPDDLKTTLNIFRGDLTIFLL